MFQCLAEYLAADPTGGLSLAGFHDFLVIKADRQYVLPVLSSARSTLLVEVDLQTVRLWVPPEQLVFIEAKVAGSLDAEDEHRHVQWSVGAEAVHLGAK